MEFEKKKKRIAAIWTAAINVVVIVVLFLSIAWKEPNPPLPEYGIQLNFGISEAGYGEEQPQELEEVFQEPEAEEQSEQVEEMAEEISEPVEEMTELQEEPSVVQEEEQKSSQEQPEQKEEKSKEEPKPKVNNKALYPGKSQGDQKEATGDQGVPEGDINEKALYGKQGGGDGGASLNIDGWDWSSIPRPNDTSDETGTISFEVTIDADGYVIQVVTLKKTVSPAIEKIYKEEVEKLSFRRTSGSTPPARSKGTITFVIRSN